MYVVHAPLSAADRPYGQYYNPIRYPCKNTNRRSPTTWATFWRRCLGATVTRYKSQEQPCESPEPPRGRAAPQMTGDAVVAGDMDVWMRPVVAVKFGRVRGTGRSRLSASRLPASAPPLKNTRQDGGDVGSGAWKSTLCPVKSPYPVNRGTTRSRSMVSRARGIRRARDHLAGRRAHGLFVGHIILVKNLKFLCLFINVFEIFNFCFAVIKFYLIVYKNKIT